MDIHKNARLTPLLRGELAEKVLLHGWTLESAEWQSLNSASRFNTRSCPEGARRTPTPRNHDGVARRRYCPRASELIALKWKDIQWQSGTLKSKRALVQGELKKAKSHDNDFPLAKPVLDVLTLWRQRTPFRGEEDCVFASPHFHGQTPYTYQILFRRHIRPVIARISGLKSSRLAPIGWHILRRSLAALLISDGENVKVTQSQLRHTTPTLPLCLYLQAVSADQQKAHAKVVQMVFPKALSKRFKTESRTAG